MKKLLLALLTVGALGTLAWLTRDRLLPPPTVSTAPPPRFRSGGAHSVTAVAPVATVVPAPGDDGDARAGVGNVPPEPQPAHPDDLEEISGIGPVYAGRLAEQGITTFAALTDADIDALSAQIDVAGSIVSDWVAQAKDRSH